MVEGLNNRTAPPNDHGTTIVAGTRGCHVPQPFRGIDQSVWKNAMRRAMQAYTSNRRKQELVRQQGRRVRRFRLKPVQPRQRRCEVIVLDKPRLNKQKPCKGPVLHIRSVDGRNDVGRGRRHAEVLFSTTLRPLGYVRIVDSARVIDRLVSDKFLLHGGLLQWNHQRNTFYLVAWTPVTVPPLRVQSETAPQRVVSLDPGARHFQVWYDPSDGAHGELLAGYRGASTTASAPHGGAQELDRRLEHVKRLADRRRRPPERSVARMTSRRALAERQRLERTEQRDRAHREWQWKRWWRAHHQRREAYRRACDRQREWCRHAHYDAIRFLLDGWDVVVASQVRFGRLMRRDTRRIGQSTVNRLLGWSHYSFNQRLTSKAQMRGALIHLTSEDGTSRTCGRCGAWNENLGSAKVMVCGACGWTADRDVNGARNNLLCALTVKQSGLCSYTGPPCPRSG